ncbi:MAG: hypothetical protein M1833_004671 [Piccolia ochrophora]|nr:MAG: hypothetical protein M1833_004671 [Piccolia ochrophora]
MAPLSDNAMLLDSEEYELIDEKQDVAIISPQSLEPEEPEQEALADDYEAMKPRVLQEIPDLETESEAVHTWQIEDWRRLPKKSHGPVFQCGGFPWRVLFFPYGNSVDYASFYLEHGFEDKPKDDWYACVQFALVLWNPNDPSIYTTHAANHRFTSDEGDWGFTRFSEIRKLFAARWEDRDRPMVENGAANMTAYVRIVKDPTGVLWHNFLNYDSKKETGYVGLKNQGATCYLNSLLQSLYFTSAFRKVGSNGWREPWAWPSLTSPQAVYQIPTQDEESLTNSAYTLQRLFYLLQTSNDAVPTAELTRSFGWEQKQIFEQQDVQELSRILMERMEEKMKGTEAENALAKLFVGKTKTYVSCVNVDFESSRIEDFWDIQLNVSGNKNLDDSFKDYIQVETMDGENKYFAEGFGLQDAKKGVIFESFPQVLHLQLKRFEYDINRDAMMKVNDRYEFPEVFDATPYLSEDADKSEPYLYQLHGVLVHSGDFNAGHYYAFLKPTKDGYFYKFDDDRVTRATMKEVLEENFGGDYAVPNGTAGFRNPYTRTVSTKRSMSAYMLVYIRKSRADEVLLDVSQKDTPPHLQEKLDAERALREQKRKEREEQHLYLPVGVITEETFKHYQGLDLALWDSNEANDAAPKQYRILRTTTIGELTKTVAQDLGRDPRYVRLWVMVNRQNKTIRPDQPLTDLDMTVDEAHAKHGTKNTGFRLCAETADPVESDQSVWPDMQPQTNVNTPVLLFLKHFDAEAQTLNGAGCVYMRKHEKVAELASPILQMMNWPAGTAIKLHEEIKPSMIEPMKPKQTLHQAEIQHGDVICFQKVLSEKETAPIIQAGGYADARDFYDHLCNRITIRFAPKPPQGRDEDSFDLVLSKKMMYDQYAAKVGEHLKVDPTHLRFCTINATSHAPKSIVKRNPNVTLQQTLSPHYGSYGAMNQLSHALYFEVLDLSLSELETKKSLKVTWLSEGITKEETFDILVPKNGTMEDLIPVLTRKANLDAETGKSIRLYEVHSNKIYKELHMNFSVASVNEFVSLYAEKVPQEELECEESDKAIYAFHFNKEPSKAHGVPFKFIVKPGEVFTKTKERLEKRTGFKGKQLEKIKFAVVQRSTYSRPIYLNDDDILSDVIADGEDLLGLDHVDRTRSIMSGRGDAIFIR